MSMAPMGLDEEDLFGFWDFLELREGIKTGCDKWNFLVFFAKVFIWSRAPKDVISQTRANEKPSSNK